jgi:TetR/AcrR family transcriptional regulator
MTAEPAKSTQRDRADQTRKAILDAAIHEFSANGLSGARTEAIAESAGANKALLYYYFKSKKDLYAAAIEEASAKVVENALTALDPKYSAGERLLRSALTHFDRVISQREFQSLLQHEMVRRQREDSGSISIFFQTVFKPLTEKLLEAVEEGIKSGELCKVDSFQVMYSMFGANVFYFLSAPMMQPVLPFNPFDIDALQARREAAVLFLANALFTDRARGTRLARRVLADMPMPQVKDFKFWRKQA